MKNKINITIDQEVLDSAKTLAHLQNRSMSNLIETLMRKHGHIKGLEDLLEETQITRGLMNYVSDLYELMKGHTFTLDEYTITNEKDFVKEFIHSLEFKLQIIEHDEEFGEYGGERKR
jgi:hypothetical protein